MKVTQEPRLWIEQQLLSQPLTERAIIFCLFRKHVEMMVSYLKSKMTTRKIFECSSGATDDLSAFQAASGVMVCTSGLSTGVTFEKVTRVYFLDCCHGPEAFLQGAGRGARFEGESCVSTLVTNKAQLKYFMHSDMPDIGKMATFCYDVIEKQLDFSSEIYKLFDHPTRNNISQTLDHSHASNMDMPMPDAKRQRCMGQHSDNSQLAGDIKVCEHVYHVT